MGQSEIFTAITAEPSNRTLRLIYADWLEERGDPLCDEWRQPLLRLIPSLEHLGEGQGPFFCFPQTYSNGDGSGNGLKNADHSGDGYGSGVDPSWQDASPLSKSGDGRGLGFANGAFLGGGSGAGMSFFGHLNGDGAIGSQTVHSGNAVF